MRRIARTLFNVLFIVLILTVFLYSVDISACTMILAGKKATADGSVLLGHNNDLPGNIASLIRVIPGSTNPMGEMITLKNGLQIPKTPRSYRMLMMHCYYGFAEGDAVAVNQFQVAVAGGVSLKADRSQQAKDADPLIKKGVSGYVRMIALARARTARECVEIIGDLYSKYGISYPSGVGVADPNEVWYMEAGGGKCWVAQRIPDDCFAAVANGYRIGKIDFNDKKNFIYPGYLKEYCIKNGLWKPKGKTTDFNFAAIFGGQKEKDNNKENNKESNNENNKYYNARRVWRIQQLLTPSLKQSPETFIHPLALKPDHKIRLEDLFSILRDRYEETPFAKTTCAGREQSENNNHGNANCQKERVIGVFNTVHTDVIQLRGDMPAEIGAVLWAGVGAALVTPYIPYYFGINEIPTPYTIAGPRFDSRSAFWRFRTLTTFAELNGQLLSDEIIPARHPLEEKILGMRETIEKTALELNKTDKKKVADFLTLYSGGLALEALHQAIDLEEKLETNLAYQSGK